uniref:N-acetyltransferase domain-containing protein n=1 Tax=Alexandrium monilatum TaxID=311494 RepID=A0A7S4VRQ5_9DINO|mmetsp:Transcript_58943/g.175366  ORF Transcript_58943/g.175366 Transcript_58943/m.175366 type:complete len:182 (-) Transcript_58943:42-587(-)
MDSPVAPREATEGDFEAIVQLFRKHEILCTLGHEQGNDDWSRMGQAYVEHTLQTEMSSWETCSGRFASAGSKLWVIEDFGKVVGCVGAVELGPGSLELVRMYVDASCRRRGFGRLLVQALLDHAVALGASEIQLTTPQVNSVGIRFYQEMGFFLRRSFPVEVDGLTLELVELAQVVEVKPT